MAASLRRFSSAPSKRTSANAIGTHLRANRRHVLEYVHPVGGMDRLVTSRKFCSQKMDVKCEIGIDLGGTKIEAIALDENGATLLRRRVPTPTGDYVGTLNAIADLVFFSERELCQNGSVGVASPGAISTRTGLLKNSNSTVLNGRPLVSDLSQNLGGQSDWKMTQIALPFLRQSTALLWVPMWCLELSLARVLAAL